ncbi:MAG: hypothetical protein IPK64_13385 [bacterium]|nr:hypothetical protein [bacterium]
MKVRFASETMGWLVGLFMMGMTGPVAAGTINWVADWVAGSPGATGTIVQNGDIIDVVYSGSFAGLAPAGYWAEGVPRPYTGNSVVGNAPTAGITLSAASDGGPLYANRLTFSTPLIDPVFALYSVGRLGLGVPYEFDRGFALLSEGVGHWGVGSFAINGNTITGFEGHGVIQFYGAVSSVGWNNPVAEFHHGFAIGVTSESGIVVKAVVRGRESGLPVPGALMTLLEDGQGVDSGTSDEQGRCSLHRAWRGPGYSYTVVVDHFGGHVEKVIGSLANQGIVEVDISVPIVNDVFGTVKDSCNKRPIAGATVEIFEISDGRVPVHVKTTDGNGVFRSDLPRGTYFFRAFKTGVIRAAETDTLYRPGFSRRMVVGQYGQTVDLGLVELETRVVVLVHGIKSSSAIWNENRYPQVLRNADWAVLDGIDLPGALLNWRGFGRIKTQAAFLKKAIDPLDVQSVNIVAHSQGGLVSRYMNENLAPHGGMVNKLIALATPQHGSPLASTVIGVREWLLKDVPGHAAYSLGALVGAVDPLLPALDDLAPNSRFLKELNQRKSGIFTHDWLGDCFWSDPGTEKGLVDNTAYATIRGEGRGGLHHVTGPLMSVQYKCHDNDGIVPTESAMLHSGSANVFNYNVGELIHHKVAATGIVADVGVRNLVLQLLAEDSSAWPPETKALGESAPASAESWDFLGYRELMVPPAGTATDTVMLDYCDSLAVFWSWFNGDVDLVLRSPAGAMVDSAAAAGDPFIDLELDRTGKYGRYVILFPEQGSWALEARSRNSTEVQNVVPLINAAGAMAMRASVEPLGDGPYSDRSIQVSLEFAGGAPVLGAAVSGTWLGPSGATGQMPLLDDGVLPDVIAGDGRYSGQLSVEHRLGPTVVEISASGSQPVVFSRTAMLGVVEESVCDIAVAPSGLTAESSNHLAYSPVVLAVTAGNSGLDDADVRVRFQAPGGVILRETTETIPAGGAIEFSATHLPLTAGVYEYGVHVVPVGEYADVDLANNSATASIAIDPAVSGVRDGDEPGSSIPVALGTRKAAIIAAYPNPFNPTIRLECAQVSAGEVTIRVFDVSGRLVRVLHSGAKSEARFVVDWDGTDDSGRLVAAGVYFAHGRFGEVEDVRKVMLLK